MNEHGIDIVYKVNVSADDKAANIKTLMNILGTGFAISPQMLEEATQFATLTLPKLTKGLAGVYSCSKICAWCTACLWVTLRKYSCTPFGLRMFKNKCVTLLTEHELPLSFDFSDFTRAFRELSKFAGYIPKECNLRPHTLVDNIAKQLNISKRARGFALRLAQKVADKQLLSYWQTTQMSGMAAGIIYLTLLEEQLRFDHAFFHHDMKQLKYYEETSKNSHVGTITQNELAYKIGSITEPTIRKCAKKIIHDSDCQKLLPFVMKAYQQTGQLRGPGIINMERCPNCGIIVKPTLNNNILVCPECKARMAK